MLMLPFLEMLFIRLQVPEEPQPPRNLEEVPEEVKPYIPDPSKLRLTCDTPCTVEYGFDEEEQIVTVTVVAE